MERINIIILIVLGSVGLFYYINTLSPKGPSNISKGITANAPFATNDLHPAESTAAKSNPEKLIIEGHKEAGEQIKVLIANYNKKTDYQIDFGDGVSKKVTKRKTYHSYTEAGNYNIQLTIKGKTDLVKRINKSIQIEASIEVSQDAFTEK